MSGSFMSHYVCLYIYEIISIGRMSMIHIYVDFLIDYRKCLCLGCEFHWFSDGRFDVFGMSKNKSLINHL